jgi:hypothetical protein
MTVGPGVVGSPTDVATLLVVLFEASRRRRFRTTLGAGVVACARSLPGVDSDDLQADLPVDDEDVRAVREVRADGGEDD